MIFIFFSEAHKSFEMQSEIFEVQNVMPVRTEDVFTRTIFTFECFNWQMRRPTLVVERLRLGPPTAAPIRHTLLQRKRTPQQIHP